MSVSEMLNDVDYCHHIPGVYTYLFSKKQYSASAEHTFIMNLCTDLCFEWTKLVLSLSRWLMHSMTYLFLSMTLSYMDMILFFMLAFRLCTRCMPRSRSDSKSSFFISPVGEDFSVKMPGKHAPHPFSRLSTLAAVGQKVMISPESLHKEVQFESRSTIPSYLSHFLQDR